MEGAKVYVEDADSTWSRATILAALGGGKYSVRLDPWSNDTSEPGKTIEVDAGKMEDGMLPFQNANMPDNGFPDMTTLDHLHEAALLDNVRQRFFFGGCPYTYTAGIVIAVNPYRWYPELYTDELRKEYLVFDKNNLPPHAYAASSAAFSGLQETRKDQAILVSGESGAGKTETVKILMGHLALIASSDDATHINRIVKSNPLLESFGNAQTVRNDNSSRFGKFIELQLDGGLRLMGSKCRTYLLEKSRIVGQDKGERNYHIFYQMLAQDEATRQSFGLGNLAYTRDSMRYTRQGQSTIDTIEGVADGAKLSSTTEALALVGVEGPVLGQLLRSLAGVLLLGQIEFSGAAGSADDAAKLSQDTAAELAATAAALEVEESALGKALTQRTIKTRNEKISKALSPGAAEATRDAVAKELYARVFDWLVGRICAATTAPAKDSQFFVGLLDIFGFESFAINRFSQLCINYANEKLQQKFTLDVFKSVQQEYADEGIPWDRIEFKDNAPLLALIESKMGIIALLNEECLRPKGSDENFVSKLTTVHKEEPAFSRPKLGAQKEVQFSIKHYAGTVMYTATGWLDRNNDAVSDDVLELLRGSGSPLIAGAFAEAPATVTEDGSGAGGGPVKKAGADTVVTKFKTSLVQLMDTIGKTSTQYVRCIKPNKNKSPVEVDNAMVVDQLRCAGVIEAIRISRAGFPARMPLAEFVQRFLPLARAVAGVGGFKRGISAARTGQEGEAKAASAAVATIGGHADAGAASRALVGALALNQQSESGRPIFEVGRTRVYFKGGVLEGLEERRALLSQAAAIEITRRLRGCHVRRIFRRKKIASVIIQASQRMHRKRVAYLATRRAMVLCQARRRAVLARRLVAELRRTRCATRLQASWLRHRAMRRLARSKWAAVRLQAAARRKNCRRQYLVDLAEHKEQAKLENQVRALQAKLEAQERALKDQALMAVSAPAANAEPTPEILDMLNCLTAERDKLRKENERQKSEIAALREENKILQAVNERQTQQLQSIQREGQPSRHQPPASPADGIARQTSGSERWSALLGGGGVAAAAPPPSSETRRGHSGKSQRASGSRSKAGGSSSSASGATFNRTPLGGDKPSEARQYKLVYPPLSDFWEDTDSGMLPLLKNGHEVHIKFGPSILLAEESSNNLTNMLWHGREDAMYQGYRRHMAFFVKSRSAAPGAPGSNLDGSLGSTFSLQSALTGKFMKVGGMLGGNQIKLAGTKIEDAAVFKFVPLLDEKSKPLADGVGALRLENEAKMLRLQQDNKVVCAPITEVNEAARRGMSVTSEVAATIEYLLPRDTYKITVEEENLGISVGSDLRVISLTRGPGYAERCGRVHVGDRITSVNDQDISGCSASDVVTMVNCKRPATIAFSVNQETPSAFAAPASALPLGDADELKAAVEKGKNALFGFAGLFTAQKPSKGSEKLEAETQSRAEDALTYEM